MKLFRFRSVFIQLFVSVMLALILFAMAMIFLTKVVQDKNNDVRSEILAGQVIEQINPFLRELNEAPNRLQTRFMLAVVKKSLDIFDESLDAKMGVYNLEGQLLIQTEGSDLPKTLPEPPSWFAKTFPTLAGVPPTTSARVLSPAGYTLFLEPRQSPKHNALTAMFNLFTGTVLLLLIMAVALWWIAHSITWRINQMNKQMVQLGEGDFSVRVPVLGKDEISTLAKGFNQSAEKIEQLINANNLLLAHASHEFRTPITRIRLQVEMMDMLAEQLPDRSQAMFIKRANAITKDLTGLNDLIESILLVSRLDAGHALQQVVDLDMYELVAQETQHYPEASLIGESIQIQGQSKLLTHLIRNLLNNALIHGVAPIQVYLYGVETKEQAILIPERLTHKAYPEVIEGETDTNIEEIKDNLLVDHSPVNEAMIQQTSTPHALDMYLIAEDTADSIQDNKQAAIVTTETANTDTTKADSSNINNGRMSKIRAKLPARPKLPTKLPSLTSNKNKPDAPNYHYLALAVVDQGSGIPKDKREDIFSPFVRLKQEKKGSGLGLSLVAQIVEAHQGQISTDTWQGHTRFLVVLPVALDKSTIPAKTFDKAKSS